MHLISDHFDCYDFLTALESMLFFPGASVFLPFELRSRHRLVSDPDNLLCFCKSLLAFPPSFLFIYIHFHGPFLSAHMVHIGMAPVRIMLLKRGVSQHKAPHSGQVVSFHPFFPSGIFLFSGMQA